MYIFRITRTRLDLLAQPPHMNVYGANIAARRRPVAPDKAQQLQEIETGAAADKESHRGGRSDAGFGQPPGLYRFPRDQSDREGI